MPLSQIPFYGGWLERGQQHDREDAQKMQQASRLMGLIQSAQQQQLAQQKHQAGLADSQREAAYRQALAGLPEGATEDDILRVARPYMGADKLGAMITSSRDRQAADRTRQAGIAATREAALSRLSLQAEGIQNAHEAKMRALDQSGANDAVKAAEVERHNRMKESFQAYAQRVAGEKLFWETGARVDAPASSNGGAPAIAGPQREQFVDIPASDRQAYEMARSGVAASPNRQVAPEEIARMVQMPGGQAAPTPQVEQPFQQPFEPAAPYDPRDLRFGSQPTAPATRTAAPAMPVFAGSPQERARAENKWRLQQTKQNTTPAGDYTKTGEDYIKTLPPEDQSLVRKVIAYEIDPRTMSVLGGRRERILSMAAQADPKFDQKEYNTQYNAINRFATGPQGNTVRSMNVAIEHMDTARKLASALANKDIRAFNEAANLIARETGGTAPTNFEAVKDILANEVVKGIIGGQSALQDREEMARKIKTSSSPAQLQGALNVWAELLGGQLVGLERQYIGATGRTSEDFRKRYITPRALEAINSVGGGQAQQGRAGSSNVPPPPPGFTVR